MATAESDIERLAREAKELPPEPDGSNDDPPTKKAVSTQATVDVSPAHMPPQPEPDTPPRKAPKRTTTAAKSGRNYQKQSKLSKLLPSAEQIKVYKIDQYTGQPKRITTWKAREVQARHGDVEAMIQQYLVPHHGEGEYQLDVYNEAGTKVKEIAVSVANPNPSAPGQPVMAPTGVSPELFNKAREDAERRAERLEQKAERLESEMRQMLQQQPTMLEQYQEMLEFQKTMGINQDDPMSRMLMMRMFDSKPSGPPPEMVAMLNDLRTEIKDLRKQAATPPPFPPLPPQPPPSPHESVNIADLMRASAEQFSTALQASKSDYDLPTLIQILKPDDSSKQAMEEMRRQMQDMQNNMLRDELRQLRETLTENKGRSTIGEAVGELKELLGFLREANRKPEQETFWGFLNGLLGEGFDRKVEAIGDLVEKVRENQKQLPTGDTSSTAQPSQPSPQPAAQRPGGVPEKLTIPADIRQHLAKIEEAEDAGGRIGATMQSFMHLGTQPGWRAFLMQTINNAKKGDRDEVMTFLRNFLTQMSKRQLLDAKVAATTVKDFDDNYEQVVEAMKQMA